MATTPRAEPVICTHCHRKLTRQRLTLPRDRTGDLGFCGFGCAEAWRVKRAAATDAPA